MTLPVISILITVHCNRAKQFEMSMSSLKRQSFPHDLFELVIIIDCYKNTELIEIVKRYKFLFSRVQCYLIQNKNYKIRHSVTRRNFLAKKASGNYILFTEPEMFHVRQSMHLALKHCEKELPNYWYCGPVYATDSIVNEKGMISVDDYTGKERINFLLSIVKKDAFLSTKKAIKYFHRIDERKFEPLFFCALLNRAFFVKIGGLNENLRVRGWEEIELFQRFKKNGGDVYFNENFKTVHLPHKRSLDLKQQIGWNLYNSTVLYNPNQNFGIISEKIEKIDIR